METLDIPMPPVAGERLCVDQLADDLEELQQVVAEGALQVALSMCATEEPYPIVMEVLEGFNAEGERVGREVYFIPATPVWAPEWTQEQAEAVSATREERLRRLREAGATMANARDQLDRPLQTAIPLDELLGDDEVEVRVLCGGCGRTAPLDGSPCSYCGSADTVAS